MSAACVCKGILTKYDGVETFLRHSPSQKISYECSGTLKVCVFCKHVKLICTRKQWSFGVIKFCYCTC